jgi:hypothetical protein
MKGAAMNWLTEVENKLKKRNQVLFDKNSEFLHDLATLIQEQNHRTLVLWAFEYADETVQEMLNRHPDEKRLAAAVQTARDWAFGKAKMPAAQRAILQAHAAAKELDSPEDIALCHAVGQACSVVHTGGHAIGYPLYELTALVRKHGVPVCKTAVEERKRTYIDRLLYWREHHEGYPCTWAPFMLKD